MLRKLFLRWVEKYLCRHEWGLYREKRWIDSESGSTIPYKIEEIHVCRKCGKLKKFTFE